MGCSWGECGRTKNWEKEGKNNKIKKINKYDHNGVYINLWYLMTSMEINFPNSSEQAPLGAVQTENSSEQAPLSVFYTEKNYVKVT